MKGKLYKESEGYYLLVSNKTIGTTRPLLNFDIIEYKLSLKNCETIERGYDLDEIKRKVFNGFDGQPNSFTIAAVERTIQIMFELMGDKKFSEEDLMEAYSRGQTNSPIQSLQQREWDVEVETVPALSNNGNVYYGDIPKLDATGCLILKRI